MKYSFEKLEVWQRARVLVKTIYTITRSFPGDEKYGLVSQLRRASVSISNNIAEGSTRWSEKDKARFYEIAFGSLIETLNLAILSNDLDLLKDETLKNLRNEIETVGRMLNSLYQSTQTPKRTSSKKPINPTPINPSTNKPINPQTNKPTNPSYHQTIFRA